MIMDLNYINEPKKIPLKAIWTTSCSKIKNNGISGIPKDFYQGNTTNYSLGM